MQLRHGHTQLHATQAQRLCAFSDVTALRDAVKSRSKSMKYELHQVCHVLTD